jgi:transcriptional regulator with XRE-family HTH domain
MRKQKLRQTSMAKIRQLLADRGWSVTELARRVDVNQRKVDRFIKSKTLPEAVLLGIKIAKMLQVPPDWLWDDEQGFPIPRTQVEELRGPDIERLAEALEMAAREIRGDSRPANQ